MLCRVLFSILALAVPLSLSHPQSTERRPALADSVKAEFLHSWDGYKKYAWGHDALKPLSKQAHDW